MKDTLNKMLAKATGQSKSQIEKDVDRDKYFTAQEAKEYGLIDKVIKKR
jgi:ATP-dependent Clp protease protease subunit